MMAEDAAGAMEEPRTQLQAEREAAQRLRNVVFAPIGGDGLVEQTVRRLSDAISAGLLADNERLPPESELSASLGIAAMTLREALAELREAGYVETRRGRDGGTFVKRPSASGVWPSGSRRSSIDHRYLRDLTDHRRAIGAEAAALAAVKASEDDLGAIADLVDRLERVRTRHGYLKLDAELHISVAAASGSVRLLKEQTKLEMELNGVVDAIAPPRARVKRTERQAEHVKLLAALREGDDAAARVVVETHVNAGGEALATWLKAANADGVQKR
jgi:DNA-binding FadR family transcriptional regulator